MDGGTVGVRDSGNWREGLGGCDGLRREEYSKIYQS